jgi:hypothetical protein
VTPGVLAETEVRPRVHVVRDVVRENALEPVDAEYDYVIEALTANRADEALDVGVLPWRSRCRDDLANLHRADGGYDVCECGIAVVQQVTRRVVLGKGVAELLRRPCGRGMGGDGDMDDPSPVVREDDEHEQQPVGDRWHNEEIGSHDLADMIGQERPPRL